MSNLSLVLMSGGARGAYQSGSLKAIAEITRSEHLPFTILSGTSAGSINAAHLACHANRFQNGINELNELWYNIHPEMIFDLNPIRLTTNALLWVKDLGFGGILGGVHGRSLLNTHPLRQLLQKQLDMDQIRLNQINGKLKSLSITATNYYSGNSVTFYDDTQHSTHWRRKSHLGIAKKITVDHVMASSAMPYFFPAVRIENAYYGDGCIRMHSPLYPAIFSGAEKILAIGVRNEQSWNEPNRMNLPYHVRYPQFAELGGIILNALFLDSLEEDVEKATAINLDLSLSTAKTLIRSKYRYLPILLLRPSMDLDYLARKASKGFPLIIRHLLKGLGVSGDCGWNLLSYLAFDSSYTSRLVELGYEDTLKEKNKILDFIEGSPSPHLRERTS